MTNTFSQSQSKLVASESRGTIPVSYVYVLFYYRQLLWCVARRVSLIFRYLSSTNVKGVFALESDSLLRTLRPWKFPKQARYERLKSPVRRGLHNNQSQSNLSFTHYCYSLPSAATTDSSSSQQHHSLIYLSTVHSPSFAPTVWKMASEVSIHPISLRCRIASSYQCNLRVYLLRQSLTLQSFS